MAVPMGGYLGQTKTMSELEKQLKAKGFDVKRAPGAPAARRPPTAPPRTIVRPAPKLVRKPVPMRPAPKPVARALPRPTPRPAAKPAKSQSVVQLQRALGVLGRKVGDRTLAVIVADGILGPKTVAATNLALKRYVKAGPQAPAAVRAGTLTPQQVATDAATLAAFIELETRKAPPPRGIAKVVTRAAAYNIGVAKLQHTVNSLAQRTNDSALTTKVDGLIGPKTVAAVNRAFSRYVTVAPPSTRTGKLTAAFIAENSVTLADFVELEVSRRLKAPSVVARRPPTKRPPIEARYVPDETEPPGPVRIRIEKDLPPGEMPPVEPPIKEEVPPAVPPPKDIVPSDQLPPDVAPTAEKKPFPTGWVVGGVLGVGALGTIVYLATRKKGRRK